MEMFNTEESKYKWSKLKMLIKKSILLSSIFIYYRITKIFVILIFLKQLFFIFLSYDNNNPICLFE